MKKKTFINLASWIVLLLTVVGIFNPAISQNLLNAPECTVFDQAHHRYLVSCYGSGAIVSIDSTGQQSYFRPPSGNLLSNTICGNTLYVSAINSIKAFDLDSGTEIWNLEIPESHQLDGMTCDGSGYLYVADFQYSGTNDQIFKINLTDKTYSIFVPPGQGLCQSPQDIIYDVENNRLLVACYYTAPIQAINLTDSTVSTVVVSPINNFDGIARDNNGNYYLTSWTTGGVHRYGPDFTNPPELIMNGLHGPANLSFNPVDNVLAVPEFDGDSVVIIPIFPVSVKEEEQGRLEIFPNPSHGKFQIRLDSPDRGEVLISLYSTDGKLISAMQHYKKEAGFITDCNISDQTGSAINLRVLIGSKVYRKSVIVMDN